MPDSKIPDCEVCAFKEIPEKCVYFDCLNAGQVEKNPTLKDQFIELYGTALERDFESFLLSVCHAELDKPSLSNKTKIRIFREHYQESDIIFIPKQKEEKPQKKRGGVEL